MFYYSINISLALANIVSYINYFVLLIVIFLAKFNMVLIQFEYKYFRLVPKMDEKSPIIQRNY